MRLTYTPNMLRNVPGEIEGFHYFVQVYNIMDGGVNLKVRGLTGTWGGCRHRNAKI